MNAAPKTTRSVKAVTHKHLCVLALSIRSLGHLYYLRRGRGGLHVNIGCGRVNYIALDLKNKGMQIFLHSEFWYTIQSYLLLTWVLNGPTMDLLDKSDYCCEFGGGREIH